MDGNGGVTRGTGWNEQIAERGEDFDETLQPPPRSEPRAPVGDDPENSPRQI